ncbi:hypothetical protein AB4Z55_03575 [Gordonia sp. ABKF26]|uniref:hypothetical protein n=1 Tax=Gordonia sp. ABKF26 TaxID=3238687 RepID=UPI0034E50835
MAPKPYVIAQTIADGGSSMRSNYVCTTAAPTALLCDGIMVGVRVLPPLDIGPRFPHNIIR